MTPAIAVVALAELESIAQAATPGPLHRRIGLAGNGSARSQHEQLCNAAGEAFVMLEHDGSSEGNANAALIVAARNALPALISVAKAVAERNASGPRGCILCGRYGDECMPTCPWVAFRAIGDAQ